MTDQELQAEWLKHNQVTICPSAEPKFEPYAGKLEKTNHFTPIKYNRNGEQVFQNLDKTPLSESLDETMRNYGE